MSAVLKPLTAPDARRRLRGRLQLLLILAMVIGPMVLASLMYKFQFWVPEGRSYHGQLIGNGQSREQLGVQSAETRWQLLVTSPQDCSHECQQLVYLARQVQIGLSRDASRASHALASATALAPDYSARLARHYPRLERLDLDLARYRALTDGLEGAHLWIVDPHGNLVLRYDATVDGKALLNDLRQLLKLSNIG